MQKAHASEPLRLFPEKLFYKIGEASEVAGVEPYVLRYWENEFPTLQPRKTKSGQRIYTKKDLDLILLIRRLLYEERYTIDGVRRKLGGGLPERERVAEPQTVSPAAVTVAPQQHPDAERIVRTVRERLRSILDRLS
ncbi:MAG: MerR family transcriptional regulator [Nitrospiraceae bacterium]|jgi:DNA-binding transcriptional MerR regulator|nr:MerR family transcriptional regulator [Nitrospiraceae bacterium]